MSWRQKKKNRRIASTRPVVKKKASAWRILSMPSLPSVGPRGWRRLLFSVVAMAALGAGWQVQAWLAGMDSLVLKQVRVGGSFEHISRARVRSLLAPYAGKHFFELDVAEIKQVLQQQPWVRRAAVRRHWPDGLEVTLLEQRPVARWGKRGLINGRAELFSPQGELPSGLPHFDGVADGEAIMLARWQDMARLLHPLGLKIATMKMDERRSLRIELDNGLQLMLGREQDIHRLQRFVTFYPRLLAARVAEVDVVDLRYPNGMVLRWLAPQDTVTQVG